MKELKGLVIKDNYYYKLIDNRDLKRLVVSQTILYPNRSTTGHAHEGIEEVYVFISGKGAIQIDSSLMSVEQGDVKIVPEGAFHKVVSSNEGLSFISIFETYERDPQ